MEGVKTSSRTLFVSRNNVEEVERMDYMYVQMKEA